MIIMEGSSGVDAAAATQVLGIVIAAVKYVRRAEVATPLWGKGQAGLKTHCLKSFPLIASLLFSLLWIYYGNGAGGMEAVVTDALPAPPFPAVIYGRRRSGRLWRAYVRSPCRTLLICHFRGVSWVFSQL